MEGKLLLYDPVQLRIKWFCGICQQNHIGHLGRRLEEFLSRQPLYCMNNRSKESVVQLYDGPNKIHIAPTGNIPFVPRQNCPECKGTGEITLFQWTEPCSLCSKNT